MHRRTRQRLIGAQTANTAVGQPVRAETDASPLPACRQAGGQPTGRSGGTVHAWGRCRSPEVGTTAGPGVSLGRWSSPIALSGRAEGRLADDEAWAGLTASYLSDALGNLLEAVGVLLEGADEAACSWDEEPGEYRWLFTRTGQTVHLRVLALPDQFPPRPDADGTLVFETRQSLQVLAAVVAEGAAAVLATHGEQKYLDLWVDHPFPTDTLRLVQAHLDHQ